MNQRCILTPVKVKESVKNKLVNRQPTLQAVSKVEALDFVTDYVSGINYQSRDRSNEHRPGFKRLRHTICYLFKTPKLVVSF